MGILMRQKAAFLMSNVPVQPHGTRKLLVQCNSSATKSRSPKALPWSHLLTQLKFLRSGLSSNRHAARKSHVQKTRLACQRDRSMFGRHTLTLNGKLVTAATTMLPNVRAVLPKPTMTTTKTMAATATGSCNVISTSPLKLTMPTRVL